MKCKHCHGTGTRFVPTNKNAITGNGYTADCLFCNGTGEIEEKPTNFARITSSPEALAEFISGFSACCDCPADKLCANYQECYKAMLEWLKQESDTE